MIPLSRLIEIASDDLNQPPLSMLPDTKSLSKIDIIGLYGAWIKLKGPKSALFDSLSNYYNVDSMRHRSVDVFLDTNRLEDGKHLQQSFISSLFKSYVITPIISKDALQRMIIHKPNKIDNVLVEWITALECVNITNNYNNNSSDDNNNNNNNDNNNKFSPKNQNDKIKLVRIFPIIFESVSDNGKVVGDLLIDDIINQANT
eukprot:gene16804-23002_t